jgi:hypothetical protein
LLIRNYASQLPNLHPFILSALTSFKYIEFSGISFDFVNLIGFWKMPWENFQTEIDEIFAWNFHISLSKEN